MWFCVNYEISIFLAHLFVRGVLGFQVLPELARLGNILPWVACAVNFHQ